MSKKPRHLIVHGAHHKMGTVWMATTLRSVCERLGFVFEQAPHGVREPNVAPTTEVFFDGHSYIDLSTVPSYRGSHMVRDLRDVAVSGFHYHKWTEEPWANRPLNPGQRRRFGVADDAPDITYSALLNSVDDSAGLLIELERLRPLCRHLGSWDFRDENILELQFEKMMSDGDQQFFEMFKWWGFDKKSAEQATTIAMNRHVSNIKSRGTELPHIRSGRSGEWGEVFGPEHVAAAKTQFGDLLIRMGYESNLEW